MHPTLVELHIPDFNKAKTFYGPLGFVEVWQRIAEGHKGYLVMKLEDNILCFWGGNDQIYSHNFFKSFPKTAPRGYGVELVIQTSNLESIYRTAQKLNAVVEKMKVQPWGLQDFRVQDPFGYYLRFTAPHNILDDKFAVE